MNRRRLSVIFGGFVAGVALVPLLAAPASAMPRHGSRVFDTDGGSFTVSWRGACHEHIAPTAVNGTWSPTLDLKVVEHGQTVWHYVKLAYKYRTFGETFIVATDIGDVSAANAVFNPPRHDYGSGQVQRSDDSWGVGFRISVSQDGSNFTTLGQPALLDCTPSSG